LILAAAAEFTLDGLAGPFLRMSEPGAAELEEFIKSSGVDEGAAAALRSSAPAIQQAVIERGDISNARNPSSALMMRLKDAKVVPAGLSVPSGNVSADVEDFIRRNDVDERAGGSLRKATPEVQQAVMTRGDLSSARNPSSAILVRIREASAGGASPGSAIAPAPIATAMPATVQGFLPQDPRAYAAYPGQCAYPAGYPAVAAMPGPVQPAYPGYPPGYPAGYPDPAAPGAAEYAAAVYSQQYAAYYAAYAAQGAAHYAAAGGAAVPHTAAYGAYPGVPAAYGALPPGALPSGGVASFVKMRGVPFSATKMDIMQFFDGFTVASSQITMGQSSEGRPSGEAFIQFSSDTEAQSAIRAKDRQRMEHRYIELFPASSNDVQKALAKSGLSGSAGGGASSRYAPY